MTEQENEARSRLLFQIDVQEEGFWFGLVVGPDQRTRRRLREAAQALCAERGIAFHLRQPAPADLRELAITLAEQHEAGLHWIVADGPQGDAQAWLQGAGRLFVAMNEQREVFRRHLRGGVVVEGRDLLKRSLRELAPDLFSIRSFVLEPGAQTQGPIPDEILPSAMLQVMAGLQQAGPGDNPDRLLDRARRLEGNTRVGPRRTRSGLLVQAVVALFARGRIEECLHWVTESLLLADELLKERPHDQGIQQRKMWLQICHGAALSRGGQLEHAEEALHAAEETARKLDAHLSLAFIIYLLSSVAIARGKPQLAETMCQQALELAEKWDHKVVIAGCTLLLGCLASQRQDSDVAERWYRQSLEVQSAWGATGLLATTYQILGIVAQDRGDLDTAEIWYRKGLEMNQSLGLRSSLPPVYYRMGLLMRDRGDLAASDSWYCKALEINDEIGDWLGMARICRQRGLLAEERGRIDEALDWIVSSAVSLFGGAEEPPSNLLWVCWRDLARLIRLHGFPALEASWQRNSGEPLPDEVREAVVKVIEGLDGTP